MLLQQLARTLALHRNCDPATFGQTKVGLVFAAVLIAGWQLATPAKAQVTNPGDSFDENFYLSWRYDLSQGRGRFDLWSRRWSPNRVNWVQLNHLRLRTEGLVFDQIATWNGDALFGTPTIVGHQNGRDLFEYDLLQPVRFSQVLEFRVTFPTEGVELFESGLAYEALFPTATSGIAILPLPLTTLDFVSIRTIPEPSAAVTLGVGAAALAALRRRSREMGVF